MSIITLRQIKDNFYKVESDLELAVKTVVFSEYIYPLQRYDFDNQIFYWGFGYCMCHLFNGSSWCSDTSNGSWTGSDIPSELFAFINNHFSNSEVYGPGNRGIHFLFPASIQIDTDYNSSVFGALPNYSDIFDDKGLYLELLDNTEQTNEVKAYINNPDPQTLPVWSQDEKNLIDFVEKYNKNVLLLRSTRKVNIENTVSTSSTSSSSVNLSGIENKLQNINTSLNNIKDNMQYTDTDDVTKGLAQIELEKDNSVLVQNNMVESAPNNPYIHSNDLFEG